MFTCEMSIIYVCTCQQENPVHGLVFLSSLLKTKSERAKNCKDLIKNETKKNNAGYKNQSVIVEHIVFILNSRMCQKEG